MQQADIALRVQAAQSPARRMSQLAGPGLPHDQNSVEKTTG
jgi:hypothetical protein